MGRLVTTFTGSMFTYAEGARASWRASAWTGVLLWTRRPVRELLFLVARSRAATETTYVCVEEVCC